ncbi:MAG: hypothetical protein ACRD4X_02025 [Candidatus Acidiferrales bacterium]
MSVRMQSMREICGRRAIGCMALRFAFGGMAAAIALASRAAAQGCAL